MHPYWGSDFFQFIGLFFTRIFGFFLGQGQSIAPDELQVYTLALLSIASSIIGGLLFLKKETMVANSLSHTVLLGLVIAVIAIPGISIYSISPILLLASALFSSLITVLSIEYMSSLFSLKKDASIGFIFMTFFALSIVLVTMYTKNLHFGIESITGNVDALHKDDLKSACATAAVCILYFSLFFYRIKAVVFDPFFAGSVGLYGKVHRYIWLFLTALVAIASLRAVGVILFLSLIVLLPAIASLVSTTYRQFFLISSVTGSLLSLVSVALSRHMLSVYNIPLSTSGLFSTLATIVFYMILVVKVVPWKRKKLYSLVNCDQ